MKQLYLECMSGISGDMCVAALLDLGADADVLNRAIETLPLKGFQTRISRVKKAGLSVCDFDVIVDKAHENHDHDMKYLYGHLEGESGHHEHSHHTTGDVHSGHVHSHGDTGAGHSHHEHRGLSDVLAIIEQTEMSSRAKELAKNIFSILGEAEAEAHGATLETVHFHEVGAVDSIVDIVAFAVCLDYLGIKEVIIPVLCEGRGSIRCQHGILPVPVPAVAAIAARHGLNLHITERKGELVTPTGAAIAAAVRTSDVLPDRFHIIKLGMGAGKRSYESPSIVRAMLIEECPSSKKEQGLSGKTINEDYIYKLESNIDDCTGENLGYVMDRLYLAGARDVSYTPIYMKKNRPAYQLNVICSEEDVERLEQIIFFETTTIGVRRGAMERSILPREIRNTVTELGEAKVKVCPVTDEKGQRFYQFYPEYDSVAALAQETGRPFKEVYQIVKEAAEKS